MEKAMEHCDIYLLKVTREELACLFWALRTKVRAFDVNSLEHDRYAKLATNVEHILWPPIIPAPPRTPPARSFADLV